MRILIVSQYFWPETFIINDLAANLQRIGHQVTVATGKPNYPGGAIMPGYKAGGLQEESFSEGVRVLRVPLCPRGSASAFNLVRNYLSFVASASWHLPRRLRSEPFDVILVFAVSPITAAIPAVILKRMKRAHLAIWVQDLWPDSLEATGHVQNPLLLSAVGRIVRWIYAAADTLLIQSAAFAGPISRYAERGKLVLFPNFAPGGLGQEQSLNQDFRALLAQGFNVVFAGNLGKAQDLDTVLAAAELLRDEAPDLRIVLAGQGSESQRLQDEVWARRLFNVHLPGWIDSAKMPELFRQADALLVTLGRTPALEVTVPSKVAAYMQAGRPIVGALNGEGARLIAESEGGLTARSGDAKGLAEAILTLMRMSSNERAEMGRSARRYFLDHLEAEQAARKLIAILSERLEGKVPS